LATVFGVVKQSGGHIWLASEPGRGTTFKVYFPRSFEADEADEAEEAEAREVSGRGTETILLVEDEPGVRAFARRALERAGYAVLEAENGAEALAIVEGHRGEIDLLLTDVVMPRMSGKVLAQRLLARRPGLRVVYMSGHTEDAIVDHGVMDGGTDFIAKPIALETLLARVRAVLDQGRDER
jgi:DNA-binding NtrC family response regulator